MHVLFASSITSLPHNQTISVFCSQSPLLQERELSHLALRSAPKGHFRHPKMSGRAKGLVQAQLAFKRVAIGRALGRQDLFRRQQLHVDRDETNPSNDDSTSKSPSRDDKKRPESRPRKVSTKEEEAR